MADLILTRDEYEALRWYAEGGRSALDAMTWEAVSGDLSAPGFDGDTVTLTLDEDTAGGLALAVADARGFYDPPDEDGGAALRTGIEGAASKLEAFMAGHGIAAPSP